VIRRPSALLAFLAAAALLSAGPGAAPARADVRMVNSSPVAAAVMSTGPQEVQITFDHVVDQRVSKILVRAETEPKDGSRSCGDLCDDGPLRCDGSELEQGLQQLADGTYRVDWTVGEGPASPLDRGSFEFTVAAPYEPGSDVFGRFLLGLVAFVVVVLAVGLLRNRFRRATRLPSYDPDRHSR
jgi:methionine-rich copper-binding protein CopC